VRSAHSAFDIHGVISAIEPVSTHAAPNVSSSRRLVAAMPAPGSPEKNITRNPKPAGSAPRARAAAARWSAYEGVP
jgi:hypothetical protein